MSRRNLTDEFKAEAVQLYRASHFEGLRSAGRGRHRAAVLGGAMASPTG